jgi:hypothetical protein
MKSGAERYDRMLSALVFSKHIDSLLMQLDFLPKLQQEISSPAML